MFHRFTFLLLGRPQPSTTINLLQSLLLYPCQSIFQTWHCTTSPVFLGLKWTQTQTFEAAFCGSCIDLCPSLYILSWFLLCCWCSAVLHLSSCWLSNSLENKEQGSYYNWACAEVHLSKLLTGIASRTGRTWSLATKGALSGRTKQWKGTKIAVMQELRRTVVPWGASWEKPHQGGTPSSQLLSGTRLMLLHNLPVTGYQYVYRTFTLVAPREIAWMEQPSLCPLFSPAQPPPSGSSPEAPASHKILALGWHLPVGSTNTYPQPSHWALAQQPALRFLVLPAEQGYFFCLPGIHTTFHSLFK